MKIEQPLLPFFTRYNPPPSLAVDVGDQSMTHQECARDCDINYIMQRYAQTGVLPSGSRLPVDSALLDAVGTDFQASMDRLIAARAEFEALPSNIRDRFAQNPAKLIEFLSDEKNRGEAERLGLLRVRDPDQPPASNSAGEKAGSGTRAAD